MILEREGREVARMIRSLEEAASHASDPRRAAAIRAAEDLLLQRYLSGALTAEVA